MPMGTPLVVMCNESGNLNVCMWRDRDVTGHWHAHAFTLSLGFSVSMRKI
jgi:hypothetical protein